MIFPSPCSFSLLLKALRKALAIKGEKSKGERERDTKIFQRKKERKKEQSSLKRRIEALLMCPSFSPQFLSFSAPKASVLFFWIFFFRFFFNANTLNNSSKKNLKDQKNRKERISVFLHTHKIQIHILIMFAATQQIASVAGLKATKVQVRILYCSLFLSF